MSGVSGTFGIRPRALLVPTRSNRGLWLGPESLRVPLLSTLGSLHHRGRSDQRVKTLTSPPKSGAALPGLPFLHKNTSVHDRRFPPATAAVPGVRIQPITIPPPPARTAPPGPF